MKTKPNTPDQLSDALNNLAKAALAALIAFDELDVEGNYLDERVALRFAYNSYFYSDLI